MKTLLVLLALVLCTSGCANISAQDPGPQGSAILKGHYIYTGQGILWNTPGWGGVDSLPSGVPTYIPETLFDGGTMEADGLGHILHCGGASWGTYSSEMNCVTTYTMQMGATDFGGSLNGRYGYGTSNQGDKATIACTETGKICVMTSHKVGWAWTLRMERE